MTDGAKTNRVSQKTLEKKGAEFTEAFNKWASKIKDPDVLKELISAVVRGNLFETYKNFEEIANKHGIAIDDELKESVRDFKDAFDSRMETLQDDAPILPEYTNHTGKNVTKEEIDAAKKDYDDYLSAPMSDEERESMRKRLAESLNKERPKDPTHEHLERYADNLDDEDPPTF